MKPSDFEQASEDDRDLLAVRFSRQVRVDDHAFAARTARLCSRGGPKPVAVDECPESTPSVHGLDGGSH